MKVIPLLFLLTTCLPASAFIHWAAADLTSSHWSVKDTAMAIGPGEAEDMFFDTSSFDAPTLLSLKVGDVWTDPRAFGNVINQAFAAREDQSQLRLPNDSASGVFVTGAALIAEGAWQDFLTTVAGGRYLPALDDARASAASTVEIEWRRQIKGTDRYECDLQVEFAQDPVSIPEPHSALLLALGLGWLMSQRGGRRGS